MPYIQKNHGYPPDKGYDLLLHVLHPIAYRDDHEKRSSHQEESKTQISITIRRSSTRVQWTGYRAQVLLHSSRLRRATTIIHHSSDIYIRLATIPGPRSAGARLRAR